MKSRLVLVFAIAVSEALFAIASGSLTFRPLPSYPNTFSTTALALNRTTVVGYYEGLGNCVHGYQQVRSTLTTIEPAGSVCSGVEGINDLGVLVGVYCPMAVGCGGEQGQYGFVMDHGVFLEVNYPLKGASTVANGINNLNEVVGGYCPGYVVCSPGGLSPSAHAFLLSHGTYTTLDYPGSVGTQAQGINDAGDTVGFYQVLSGGQHGYLYRKGVFTSLDPPGAQLTIARGINNAGTISGLFVDSVGVTHGFTMQNGVYTTMTVPHSTSSAVAGINSIGSVVAIGVVNPIGPPLPFIAMPTAPTTADSSAEAASRSAR